MKGIATASTPTHKRYIDLEYSADSDIEIVIDVSSYSRPSPTSGNALLSAAQKLIVYDKKDKISKETMLPIMKPVGVLTADTLSSLDLFLNRVRSRKYLHPKQKDYYIVDSNNQNKNKSVESKDNYRHKNTVEYYRRSLFKIPQSKDQKYIDVDYYSARRHEDELAREQKYKLARYEAYRKERAAKEERFRRQNQTIDRCNLPKWLYCKIYRKEANKSKYPVIGAMDGDVRDEFEVYKDLKRDRTRRANEIREERLAILFEESNLRYNDKYKYKDKDKYKEKYKYKYKEKEKYKYKEKYKEKMLERRRIKYIKLKYAYKERYEYILTMLSAMVGSPRKKVKLTYPDDYGLQNTYVLYKLDESDYYNKIYELTRRNLANRCGLNYIIRNYASYAPGFIKLVLSHNYQKEMLITETKKIPHVFHEQMTYKKAFHYLVTNYCIADIYSRLEKIEKGNEESVIVTIIRTRPGKDGLMEVLLNYVQTEDTGTNTLRSLSLSRYRLGLLTNLSKFELSGYGVPSANNKKRFAILCMICTPYTKEDLNSYIRVLANFRYYYLSKILQTNKTKQANFYDMYKLSTHIREYLAISNVAYSYLSPIILNPTLLDTQQSIFVQHRDCLYDILKQLEKVFNFTQFYSIRYMVLRESGIVMLQGPPGTGKTSTLMGLVAAQYEYLKKTRDCRKIMICAPSNAAVDHVTRRIITEGLINGEGEIVHPRIVRMGIIESLDPLIKAVSLDELCEKMMLAEYAENLKDYKMTTPQIKEKIISVQKYLRNLSKVKESKDPYLKSLKDQLVRYQGMLFQFRKQKIIFSSKSYAAIEDAELGKAEIILTTLSSSGSDKVYKIRGEIACLIVDEAAQTTYPNLLIALQTGVYKVLLIGDPCQLPATCMSSDANVTLFNRSLFYRFIDAKIKPYFLNIQYRMNPLIREFPSKQFYQNRLIDSDILATRSIPDKLTSFSEQCVYFLDVKWGTDIQRYGSYSNSAEVFIVRKLITRFMSDGVSIGVITPYRSQRQYILRQCKYTLSEENYSVFEETVKVNTIDSFQGQEKDVIIVSTVRANSANNVGFLLDERRINVTLTRSKHLLIVVGHGDTLGSNEVWDAYLNWMASKRAYYVMHNRYEASYMIDRLERSKGPLDVNRKVHRQLTQDIRKYERSYIQSKDFVSRKKNKYYSIHRHKEGYQRGQTYERSNYNSHDYIVPPISAKSQRSIDIHESHRLVYYKRKKEYEAYQFYAINSRLGQLEYYFKRGASDDDFLRQLFM